LSNDYSLSRFIDVTQPQSGWHIFDLARGDSPAALACANAGAKVIVGNLTLSGLQAARQQHQSSLLYISSDASQLPFSSNSLDLITCYLTAHHLPDVPKFILESVRILKQGGRLAVVDTISPEQPKAARYCNLIESLRDSSHIWAYSLSAWHDFFEGAGLTVRHSEQIVLNQQVGNWAKQGGCNQMAIEQLHVMLWQAPESVREWYGVATKTENSPDLDGAFSTQQALMVAQK